MSLTIQQMSILAIILVLSLIISIAVCVWIVVLAMREHVWHKLARLGYPIAIIALDGYFLDRLQYFITGEDGMSTFLLFSAVIVGFIGMGFRFIELLFELYQSSRKGG